MSNKNRRVPYTCIGCGTQKILRFQRKNFDGDKCLWKCLSCITKARWDDPNYRTKWKATSLSTKTKRSERSKKLWTDADRLANLSQKVKDAWKRPEYRDIKTTQSRKFWEDDEYIDKQLNGMKKVSKFLSDRLRGLWKTKKYRERAVSLLATYRTNHCVHVSNVQRKLYAILEELNIVHNKEEIGSQATKIGMYAFDCLVPKQNQMTKDLLIEVQGDYWHSLEKNRQNDRSKFTYVDRYHPEYKIAYLWEHEFKDKDAIKTRIKKLVGLPIEQQTFNFNDLEVKQADLHDAKKLLDAYHYIGGNTNGLVVGAHLNDKLIACLLYTPPVRQSTAIQFGLRHDEVIELARMCMDPAYNKRNFASWLIARSIPFIGKQKKLMVSYSDRTAGHDGTVYKASGFTHHHVVPPSYWYLSPSNKLYHKRTIYGRAVKAGLIEREFAAKYALLKKYGGPKDCFIKRL